MKQNLCVTLVETDLIWENPEANRSSLEERLSKHTRSTDIFVLPEMFTCGFTMKPEKVAEAITGDTITWLKTLSGKVGAAICGSIPILENDNYYNRFVFATPDQQLYFYDKKHTFTLAGEHEAYEAGNAKIILEYEGWRICPMICYDLRFPVWARNTENYDLIMYVANWPKPRINAWDALLKARAIENMSFCVGVNRIGFDGNGHEYPGHSAVYDVLGRLLEVETDTASGFSTAVLNKGSIGKYRSKLNFLEDRDHFQIITETHK